MKLLVIGGTQFVGRHLVDIAARNGHEVTTFNRGSTVLSEQSAIERLHGDRTADLSALIERRWDAVIDTCGYEPAVVQRSVAVLRKSVKQYVFISSKSVYKDFSNPGVNESSELKASPESDYGSLKAQCEQAVMNGFGSQSLILRCGLIVGPYDQSDRFTYWPQRIQRGGEVLAPGRPERKVQFIDVRDLGEWIVHAITDSINGIFNVTGPALDLTMNQFLKTCIETIGSEVRLVWKSDDFLLDGGVSPWVEMPLWIPENMIEMRYFTEVDHSKALAAGLHCRSLADTIRDTLAWHQGRSSDTLLCAGLDSIKEQSLLGGK